LVDLWEAPDASFPSAMNPSCAKAEVGTTRLTRFLDRIRYAVSHDLRTPLGTIVNYATVLEAAQGPGSFETRDLAGRIRRNAQRSARMVQLLVTVIGLASRPLASSSTDLLVLVRSILGDAGGRGSAHLLPDSQASNVSVDAEVVGFAWRAYLATESDSSGKPVDAAGILVRQDEDSVQIDLRCDASETAQDPGTEAVERTDLLGYLRFSHGPARLENSLGLGLAEELVVCHGGTLEMFGKPGARSGIRIRLPGAGQA
jgi:light-regulated signal transduction histidine kinase (bacteriophytochrome)